MKKRLNKKGFTLIELIVVIAILGILAAIAIPRFSGFQDNAKNKAVLAEAKTLANTIAVLETDSKTFVATESTEDTDTFTDAEILGYAGMKSGGALASTTASAKITSFTWAKQFGADIFTITYTVSTDSFNTPAKTQGTVSDTTPDTSY